MEVAKEKYQRLDYLDICKGFGIFAITLGHIYNDNYFRTWLSSFDLPLFFIITGILIKYTNSMNRNFINIVTSRFTRLIIPYCMFEMLAIIGFMIWNHQFTWSIFKYNILNTLMLYEKAGATWFLPALFISELTFIGLKKIIKNDKVIIILSLIIFIVPFFIHTVNHFGIVFIRNFTAIGFIAFGYYGYNFLIQNDISMKYLIIALMVNIILAILNKNVDLYSLKYNNAILYFICSISGSCIAIFIFKKLKLNKVKLLFRYFGLNSLIVMATQQVILWSIIKKITGIDTFNYNFIYGTVVFVLIMIIEVPIIEVINRYLPFLLGNFNKNIQTKTN